MLGSESLIEIVPPGHLHDNRAEQAGEQIVVSGTFLIASESRLRTAAALWDAPAEVSPAAP